jgi:hypothetical protein
MLKDEYLNSFQGSTPAELQHLANAYGLYTATFTNLTLSDLGAFSTPVILYVKSRDTAEVFNHYILFMGNKNGQAWVFNPPTEMELIPYKDLVLRWEVSV